MVLAQPPIVLPPECRMELHRGRPLAENIRERSHLYLHRWPAQRLQSVRFPYMGYVLEGEIDWRIGTTRSMAKQLPESLFHCDYQTLTLPKNTFFLMPPGVPYSIGEVHWHRPQPEQAKSRVFWIQMLPTGIFCHMCHTTNGTHASDAALFIRDTRLAPAVELLIHELQLRTSHFKEVARSQLLTMFLRIGRALAESRAIDGDAMFAESIFQQNAVASPNEQAVQRACAFIEDHLDKLLAPAMVAEHAYVSSSHLNRLFRAEFGLSIMQYVARRRLETAKSLLVDSDLPVLEIGKIVGYYNPSYFTQFFSQAEQISPLEYRKKQRAKSTFTAPHEK